MSSRRASRRKNLGEQNIQLKIYFFVALRAERFFVVLRAERFFVVVALVAFALFVLFVPFVLFVAAVVFAAFFSAGFRAFSGGVPGIRLAFRVCCFSASPS